MTAGAPLGSRHVSRATIRALLSPVSTRSFASEGSAILRASRCWAPIVMTTPGSPRFRPQPTAGSWLRARTTRRSRSTTSRGALFVRGSPVIARSWSPSVFPQTARIYLSTGDGTARFWRVASGDHEVVSEDLGQGVKLGVWAPDARSYVFANSLNRVLLVDAPDGTVRESFEVPGFAITSATLSTDGAFVIACGFDQQVTILRLGTSGTAASLDLNKKLGKAAAIAPAADVAAVVVSGPLGRDRQMRLFHLPIARERFSTTAWTPGKGAMTLLDGGRRIASVHEYGRTRGELSGVLKRWHWSRDHSIYTVCSASSLGGRWLAYVLSDGKVGLWNSQQEDVEKVATDAFRPDYRDVSQDVPEQNQELLRFLRATLNVRNVGLAVNDSGDCLAIMHPVPELASANKDAEYRPTR